MSIQSLPPNAQLLRLPVVIERTGLSRSTIWRRQAEGTFPASIKIGENTTAWLASDIDRWIADRIAESRGA